MIYCPECDHRLYRWFIWTSSLIVGLLMVAPVAYAFWTWDAFGKPAPEPPPDYDKSLFGDPLWQFRDCQTLGRCTVALIQGIDWGYQLWVVWLWLRIAAFAIGLSLIIEAITDMKLTLFPVRRKRKAKV